MDDEKIIIDVVKAMLNKIGHDVVLAQNGEEAIHLFNKAFDSAAPIDLMIMDLTIPKGMGGKEAVHEILKIDPNAKVIISSGYSQDPAIINFKDYGFSAAIVKPFQLKTLINIINQLTD
ncbi:MAG: response regulator [Pseudomonadota bacterium]